MWCFSPIPARSRRRASSPTGSRLRATRRRPRLVSTKITALLAIQLSDWPVIALAILLDNRIPGAHLVEIDAGLFGIGADLDEMRSDLDGASAYMLGFDDERVDLEQSSLTLSLGTEAIRLRAKDNGRKGVRVARGGDKKAVERISGRTPRERLGL